MFNAWLVKQGLHTDAGQTIFCTDILPDRIPEWICMWILDEYVFFCSREFF
jgi:hypothetical protein